MMKLFNYALSDRKKSLLVLLLALLSLSPMYAAQGYAVFDSSTGTLTFKYGTPTGTAGTDYYNTDATGWNKPGWYDIRSSVTKVVFDPSFASARPTSCYYWFGEFTSLKTEIEGIEYLNTSNVQIMREMFWYCHSLPRLDVSHFNTAKVQNMIRMFGNCMSLKSLDVSNFNTQNVIYMQSMFYYCQSLTSLDVSHFNTAKVTTMESMFAGCWALNTIDVSRFKTENVTNMGYMFWCCYHVDNLDVSHFNTKKVTGVGMEGMFGHCHNLNNINVSNFNTANVTSMQHMFSNCRTFTSLDVSNFNTSKVTNMRGMFDGCINLPSLDIRNFNTQNVTDMREMFRSCYKLSSLDLRSFNTAKVTLMSEMFSLCHYLRSLDIRHFNTQNVTNMKEMFYECWALTSLTFGQNFSTEKITSSSNKTDVFNGCSKLRYIDFYTSDDTDAITEVGRTSSSSMFNNVPQTTVIYLPHGSQDVTNVRNVVYSRNRDENDLWCPEYYSEDKVDIEFPRNFQANEAKYSRRMKAATKYGTTILPYAFESDDEVQAYTLHHEMTDAMYFVVADRVEAHTPFFYQKKNANATTVNFNMADATDGITVNATHTTSAAEGGEPYQTGSGMTDWATKGYYITETIDAYNNGTFYISGDKFLKAMGTVKMNPHRVTFHGEWTMDPSTSSSNIMPFELLDGDDVTNSITDALEAADQREAVNGARAIYDAQGRQHTELQKGLNIVLHKDGSVRKVFVR